MSSTARPPAPGSSPERPTAPSGDTLVIPPLARRALWRRVALALLVVAAGVGAWMSTRPDGVVPERFRTTPVERRHVVRIVEATGTLDVRRRVAIPAPVPGRLTSIDVGVRDRVVQGQVLGRLDARAAALVTATADAEVKAAEARLAESRAALDAARRERERTERLLGRGLVSRQEADTASAREAQTAAAVDAARGALKVAEQGRAQARLGAALTDIAAPEDGVVLVAPEAVGAAVAPDGPPLFVLGSSLEEMRVEARVGEADIGTVQVGQEAEFEVLAWPGRHFPAKVVGIGLEPVRDGALVYYPVALAAANPDGLLLPGMTTSVRMKVAEETDVLAVPEAALRFTPEEADSAAPRSRVFVRVGPRALDEVPVEPGISDGAYTAVTAAAGAKLEPGTPVAVGIADRSGGGAKVRRPGLKLGEKGK